MYIVRSQNLNGGELVMIALTAENIQRMRAGRGIFLTDQHGIPQDWTVVIMACKNEEEAAAAFRRTGFLDNASKVTVVDPHIES